MKTTNSNNTTTGALDNAGFMDYEYYIPTEDITLEGVEFKKGQRVSFGTSYLMAIQETNYLDANLQTIVPIKEFIDSHPNLFKKIR